MIQISKERYAQLLRAEYELSCLEYWGVDNWTGYDDALNTSEGGKLSAKDLYKMNDDEIIKYCGNEIC